jgi:ABC-type branched-subunit amino acid transport system substrate-binding protein
MSLPLHRRRVAMFGAATAAVLTLAACGGADSADEAEAPAQSFTGSPVKVMTFTPTNTQTLNAPEVMDAAQGAVKAINAAGGINGSELQLVECNEGATPNTAAACARQAVEEEVVAVVGGFTTNGGSVTSVLEPAGIPYIAPAALSAEEFSSPISYPIQAGAVGFAGLGQKAGEACESVAVVRYDVPAAAGAVRLIGAGLAKAGQQPAADVKVPPTTTDFSSVARTAGESDCAVVALPTEQYQALSASAQGLGLETTYYAASGSIAGEVLESGAPAIEGDTMVSSFLASSASEWDQAKEAAGEDLDWDSVYVQNTWVGYQVFREVAEALSSIDAASVKEALDSATSVDTGGLTAPIDFSKPLPVPGLNRITNTKVVYLTAEDGTLVQQGDFEDVAALLAP